MEEPDLTDFKTAGFGEHSLQFSPWSQPSNKELIPSNIRAEAAPCSQRSKTDLCLKSKKRHWFCVFCRNSDIRQEREGNDLR